MRLRIDNEYDKLEAVLVHRPGNEIDRLTHEIKQRFLFEDVPYLRRMQDEHDAFVGTMRGQGVQVHYLKDLLAEVLRDESDRRELMAEVCRAEGVAAMTDDLAGLRYWNEQEALDLLFAGLTIGEYQDATGKRMAAGSNGDHFLLPPIPNAYFSRDPAVIVRDAAISSKMHFAERVRETLLTRAVLEHHPEFRDNVMTYGGTDEPTEDRPYTIEGGDVIILSPDAVIVGDSERTRSETIEMLAAKCFQYGHVKRVYEIPIPSNRAFMHLDTVFTILDRGVVVWYSEVMSVIKWIHRYEPRGEDDPTAVRVSEERSFPDILRDEFEMDVTIIETAGGSKPHDAREQRADGTNVLALAPRLAVTYKRNERTNAALESHGIICLGIDDAELVRGLGGPRCMTMPLRRSSGDGAIR